MNKKQQGTTLVEFALIIAGLLLLLFFIIELGRALFVYNALAEGTRRGARLAVVCPMSEIEKIKSAVIFGNDGSSLIAPGLTTANVQVSYLNTQDKEEADGDNVSYVRVKIINYNHPFLVPFIEYSGNGLLSVPGFTAVIPRESLGYAPTTKEYPPC